MPKLKETLARPWRVGSKVPLNVYRNDRIMFQCHTPEDAAEVVGLLNAAEECEKLRADKERLDWLDNLPESTEFTPSEYGSTIREAIDAARSLQTHGRVPESTAEAKAKADPRKEKAE